jgi:hypothetical protein
MTPGLPFVPAIGVMVNIYLIFKLSILTLVRFTVWMAIGTVQTLPRTDKFCCKLIFKMIHTELRGSTV